MVSFGSRRVLAVLWTFGILAACTVPGGSLPSVSLFEFDKLIHFALFAGLGGLWMWSGRSSGRRRVLWVGAAGLAYAWLTEVYQGLIPFGRSADPYDAIANTLGLIAGILLALALLRRRSGKPVEGRSS